MGRKFAENAINIPADFEPRSVNNNVLFQVLFDRMFGDILPQLSEGKKKNIEIKDNLQGSFRMFYIATACTKENFSKEQTLINEMFSTFANQLAKIETKGLKCSLDVILPIIGALRPFTCVTEKMTSATPLDSMRLWCIETNKLWDVMMRQMAQRQFGFVVINVQGIPMKDTGSKASNYDVEMACKVSAF